MTTPQEKAALALDVALAAHKAHPTADTAYALDAAWAAHFAALQAAPGPVDAGGRLPR